MTERNDLHLLAGAYALGALSEAERIEFEHYLETSEEARAEVASLSDTAVMLGLATEPVAPPVSLRASILAQAAQTPQRAPLAQDAEQNDEQDAPPAPTLAAARAINAAGASTAPLGSSAESRARARWYRRPVTYVTAVAAAAALIFGGVAVTSAITSTQISAQQSSFAEISAASDAQRASEAVEGGGKATLIWSNKLGRSAVVITGLAALPTGKTYQLWYIAGSDATPAGTFVPSSGGKDVKVLTGTMAAGDTVGITVEPSGGSQHPSTKPVVAIATV